ncbi:hypothetical protein ANN_18415 [Periplaneta americana]|uniref:Uncharacterized protein n=1 Tax=Periplaneta americana TaxID=6978 RepID=A0ABQ8SPW4_PERAM|nr:hypothetical protein ANN_18415 [Periplaneta americana]
MAGLCEGGNEPPGSLKAICTGFLYEHVSFTFLTKEAMLGFLNLLARFEFTNLLCQGAELAREGWKAWGKRWFPVHNPPALNDVSVARTQSHKTDTEYKSPPLQSQ